MAPATAPLRSLVVATAPPSSSSPWRVRSAVTLSLGVDNFFGDPQGLFGEFREASRAIATVEIGF